MASRWSSRISTGNSSTTPLGAEGALSPEFRAIATAHNNGVDGTSLTINKPAGVVLNDVMVAQIVCDAAAVTVTPPAGWTQIRTDSHDDALVAANRTRSTLFWKRAGGSEPANYAFTTNVSVDLLGAISAYVNIATAGDPVNANGGQIETAVVNDTTITAPSIAATAGSMLVGCFVVGETGFTFTPPPGMTERADFADPGTMSDLVTDENFGAGGDTGTRVATFSPAIAPAVVGRGMIGQLVALTPAQAGGGASFFGVAEDMLNYSGARIVVETNEFGVVQAEFSQDGINWRIAEEFPISGTRFDPVGLISRSESVPVHGQFMRVNYENLGAAQGFFRLQTTLLPEVDQPLNRVPQTFARYNALGVSAAAGGVFTTALTVSGDDARAAFEVVAFGVIPASLLAASFPYTMQLQLGTLSSGIVMEKHIRSDAGSWEHVPISTLGMDIRVRVTHGEVAAQDFDVFLIVKEP